MRPLRRGATRNSTTSSADISVFRKRSLHLAVTACAEAAISSSRRSKMACTTGSPSRSCVMSTCCRSIPVPTVSAGNRYAVINVTYPPLLAVTPDSRSRAFRSGENLDRARVAGAERALYRHVQQPERLELARAAAGPAIDRVEASVAGKRRNRVLRSLVVPGDQHVERLPRHLAGDQRVRERGVEGL